MSHFSKVKTLLRDRECLIAALTELKLPPQVYDKPKKLKGFYGNQDEYNAEIIITGKVINARADIGFKWNQEAQIYETICDRYETDPKLGRNFFTHKLMQAYGNQVVRTKARELEERFGNCTVVESTQGSVQTLRLTFAAHQHQHQRR